MAVLGARSLFVFCLSLETGLGASRVFFASSALF